MRLLLTRRPAQAGDLEAGLRATDGPDGVPFEVGFLPGQDAGGRAVRLRHPHPTDHPGLTQHPHGARPGGGHPHAGRHVPVPARRRQGARSVRARHHQLLFCRLPLMNTSKSQMIKAHSLTCR